MERYSFGLAQQSMLFLSVLKITFGKNKLVEQSVMHTGYQDRI